MRHRNAAEGPVHISKVIADLGPLFDQVPEHDVPKDMHRRMDHDTSIGAARVVLPHLTQLQHRVMDAFRANGAMNDEQLEQLACFTDCSPSTIRKRRSELVERGELTCTGRTMNAKGNAAMKVWSLVTPAMEKVG